MSNHSKHPDIFDHRHIGPNDSQIQSMLKTIDYNSLNDLIDTTIPPSIRFNHPTPESFNEGPKSEFETLRDLETLGYHNKIFNSYIGMGYNDRSEEHTSELQSLVNLVCRLLLEKKKKTQ